MSSISSISSSLTSYFFQNNLSKVSNTSQQDEESSLWESLISSANLISNIDGDTFELSSSSSATNSNASFDFKSFLDKVKNGTVTESDLEEAQTALSQTELPGSSDPIGSFLQKVKEGTVTESDLNDMQVTLNQAPPPPPPPPPGAEKASDDSSSSESSSSDLIKDFLDKVKNGTVTQDDLTTIQTLLNQMQQSSEVKLW